MADQFYPPAFPAPYDPRGRRPSEPPVQPPQAFEVKFPPSPDPVTRSVFRDTLRSLARAISESLPWPRSGPLSIFVTNTQDAVVTVEVYTNPNPDTSRLTSEPALAFEVGPNDRRTETLNPEGDDDWAPYAFVVLSPKTVPTTGDIDVSFSRPG